MKTQFDPTKISGEDFAASLKITVLGKVATVIFPDGSKSKGKKKAWLTDSMAASAHLINIAPQFQLVACARQRICAEIEAAIQ